MKIKQFIHFADNHQIDASRDKFAKVQPLIDYLNQALAQFGVFHEHMSVDERMVSYTGRHSCKQYIREKPIKWGYKMWIIASDDGFPYFIIMYQRRSLSVRTVPFGQQVVMDLVDAIRKMECDLSSVKLYFDNFFSSYSVG